MIIIRDHLFPSGSRKEHSLNPSTNSLEPTLQVPVIGAFLTGIDFPKTPQSKCLFAISLILKSPWRSSCLTRNNWFELGLNNFVSINVRRKVAICFRRELWLFFCSKKRFWWFNYSMISYHCHKCFPISLGHVVNKPRLVFPFLPFCSFFFFSSHHSAALHILSRSLCL